MESPAVRIYAHPAIHWHTPNIVGTICDPASLRTASRRDNGCDILEIRADLFYPPTLAETLKKLPQPKILTVRAASEGGAKTLTPATRTSRYIHLITEASAIDIEIAHIRAMRLALDATRKFNVPFIASMHDFHGVPSRRAIARAVTRARDAGAACIKVAALTETSRDLAKLIDCLDLLEGTPFALMGMGRYALVSRVLFMNCGSCLNYAALATPTAPNQPTVKQLKCGQELLAPAKR